MRARRGGLVAGAAPTMLHGRANPNIGASDPRFPAPDDEDELDVRVPLQVGVVADCWGAAAALGERRLAMECASQQRTAPSGRGSDALQPASM